MENKSYRFTSESDTFQAFQSENLCCEEQPVV